MKYKMMCARCDAQVESDSIPEVIAWDDNHDDVCPVLNGADQ